LWTQRPGEQKRKSGGAAGVSGSVGRTLTRRKRRRIASGGAAAASGELTVESSGGSTREGEDGTQHHPGMGDEPKPTLSKEAKVEAEVKAIGSAQSKPRRQRRKA